MAGVTVRRCDGATVQRCIGPRHHHPMARAEEADVPARHTHTRALRTSSRSRATERPPCGATHPMCAVHPSPTLPRGQVPIVNFGSSGVVRCGRCRTYINAFVQFADGGRRWRCNVCGKLNDVPADYFCDLDGEGKRRDRMERSELHMGTVEFVAAAEYMVRPPQPPVYLFVIEVSYAAVASGMLRCVAATLQHTLQHLPGGERTQVGLITFDSVLHFYNLSGSTPQMMVVPEVDETFLPLPGDLLVNLQEKTEQLTGLFEKLPAMFAASQAVEVALGPALRAAMQVLSRANSVQRHAITQPRRRAATPPHRHTAAPSHRNTATPLHRWTIPWRRSSSTLVARCRSSAARGRRLAKPSSRTARAGRGPPRMMARVRACCSPTVTFTRTWPSSARSSRSALRLRLDVSVGVTATSRRYSYVSALQSRDMLVGVTVTWPWPSSARSRSPFMPALCYLTLARPPLAP